MKDYQIRIKDGATIAGYAHNHARVSIVPGVYESQWAEINITIGGDVRRDQGLIIFDALNDPSAHDKSITVLSSEYPGDLEGFPDIDTASSIEVLDSM